jgi:hypothetical protein
MFRVGDMRKSHIIEAHVRAQIIKRKVSEDDDKSSDGSGAGCIALRGDGFKLS